MAPVYYDQLRHYMAIPTTGMWHSSCYHSICQTAPEPETEKEKKARLAKEKMLASWALYNKKTVTIKQQIQICKPIHRILPIGFRKR